MGDDSPPFGKVVERYPPHAVAGRLLWASGTVAKRASELHVGQPQRAVLLMRWWFLFLGVGLGVLFTCLGRSILARLADWKGRGSPPDLEASPSGSEKREVSPSDRRNITQLVRQLAILTEEYSDDLEMQRNRLSGCLERAQQQGPDSPGGAADIVSPYLEQLIVSTTRVQQRVRSACETLLGQAVQLESDLSEARTDSLTGLVNRRAFDAKIEELFLAHRAGGDAFVLALIDIDHFKQINDNFGHQAGDDVLRFVASAFRQAFEKAYLVARYGGEEFAVILPSPLRLAADRVDALRKKLSREQIESSGTVLRITFSAGLSEPRQDLVSAHLIRRADEALYSAKNMGRDRVYYHDGTQSVLLEVPEIADPTI